MSLAPRESRSFASIADEDLVRLAAIATGAIERVCRPQNKSGIYRNRLLLLCLCQGAALHYYQVQAGRRKAHGINDFDVWGFFRRHSSRPFPPRWRAEEDFGASRFARSPADVGRLGRRVDVIGRSIDFHPDEDAVSGVLRWLCGPGESPFCLRQHPVYVISPGPDFGRLIWPGG